MPLVIFVLNEVVAYTSGILSVKPSVSWLRPRFDEDFSIIILRQGGNERGVELEIAR